MLMELESGFRRLSAPQHDGETLIDPPWGELPEIVAASRQRLFATDYDVQGRALRDLAASARRMLVNRAAEYTRQYRDITGAVHSAHKLANVPFILSGHQPQLFHPGVWYKNFVLGGLACRLDGVGIHLLIDSDLCRTSSIRVPTGTARQPRMEAVPYDQPGPEVPYEERTIRDARALASFAQRTLALMQPLVSDPLIKSMWPLVVDRNPAQAKSVCVPEGRRDSSPPFQRRVCDVHPPSSRGATVERQGWRTISPQNMTHALLFLRTPTQSSLRDWGIKITLFPALKSRARLNSRSAAKNDEPHN